MTDLYEWGTDEGASTTEDRAALRRRVLNVIGHELRTPVTTLRGLADQLTAADERTIRDELGPAIVRVAARVEALCDDLLLAAGISTTLPTTPTEEVPLREAVAAAWDAVPMGEGQARLDGDTEAVVLVRRAGLVRALVQVFDNAEKYGSRTQVTVLAGESTVALRVACHGPDPHPEEIRLGPAPFYRGERAVTTAPGLGVGLTIAKALVEHDGGALHFEPREGGGTVTTLILPGAQP